MKKSKRSAPKERNPFVEHVRLKSSGAHGKPKKALRKRDKDVMRTKLRKGEDP